MSDERLFYFILLLTAVRAPAAREQEDLVACSATGVEVQASVRLHEVSKDFHCVKKSYQAADDKSLALDVVVNSRGNNIPGLVLAAITGDRGDWGEILAEITRERVDGETFAIRSL